MSETGLSERNFAEHLKKLRTSHTPPYSQEKMADILGVSRSAYASYETGRRNPPVYIVIAAAKHFGINVDDLLRPQERS